MAGDSSEIDLSAIDTSVPHSARVWNYWLGGKDNFAVDRVAGDQYREAFPDIVPLARESRRFLGRVVTYLAGEVGIRQFLDVGTGLPTADNTHEVAQRVAPDARIVYVDNDPLVLAHARALLVSTPEGATDYVDADMRHPETVLAGAAKTLDLSKPVALLFMGVLGHIPDTGQARAIVTGLLDGLPSGSYMALSDGTTDMGEGAEQAEEEYADSGATPYVSRTPEELASFFDGLELVEPGLVSMEHWRPQLVAVDAPARFGLAGVARKP